MVCGSYDRLGDSLFGGGWVAPLAAQVYARLAGDQVDDVADLRPSADELSPLALVEKAGEDLGEFVGRLLGIEVAA
jgi:hypothetical protein